jgi:hypothetical protein
MLANEPDRRPDRASAFWEHWVAWALTAGIVLAVVAGVLVSVPRPAPSWALEQPIIYRIEFGGVLLVVGYVLLIAMRLGWHNRTFSKLTLGPAGAEAQPAERAAADELTQLRAQITALTEAMSETVEDLNARVDALEVAVRGNADPEVS